MQPLDTWVLLAIAAAAAQSLRFALQKVLSVDGLSAVASTWARFLWSAPLVALLLAVWLSVTGRDFPSPDLAFAGYAILGGLCQILATICVVALFSHRAFAIGITFKKTEVLLTALAGFLILGDRLSGLALLAVGVGFLGVLLLSRRPGATVFDRKAVALGLASGVFFALSAVGYRGATLALDAGDTLITAGAALLMVTSGQALVLAAWLWLTDRSQIALTLSHWRVGLATGLTSLTGSWCWFAAFSLANAALVFAVGQVELIFSLAIGAFWFRERIGAREAGGIALLAVSIICVAALA